MTLPELELKELPDDIRELFTKAREYQQLQATPGFRRLLDFIGSRVDLQLAAVRASRSDDDRVNARLALRWKAFEDMLALIQNEINGTLQDRDDYLRDALRYRAAEGEVEKVIQGQYEGVL